MEDFTTNTTSLKAHYLPIETPFHASHLYGPEDTDEVLKASVNGSLESYKLRIPIISPASGAIVEECNFKDLLRQAIHTTLREQVRWDKILVACVDLVTQDETHQACVILPCASNSATLMSSTLSNIRSKDVSISNILHSSIANAQPSIPTGRFEDSKIAIVGFSGRFPDAASNDEFWQLLHSGKDTHRTIPRDRFDWEAHFDPSGAMKNSSKVKYGCFVNEPVMRFRKIYPGSRVNILSGTV